MSSQQYDMTVSSRGASEISRDRLDYLSDLSPPTFTLTPVLDSDSQPLLSTLSKKNGYVMNLSSEIAQLKFLSADFQV